LPLNLKTLLWKAAQEVQIMENLVLALKKFSMK
jgi:hypothetical protein